MASSDAAKNICKVSLGRGIGMDGSWCRATFRWCRAFLASGVHLNWFLSMYHFSVCKRGRAFSADLAINLSSAVNHPLISCTSLRLWGILEPRNSFILAIFPYWLIYNPVTSLPPPRKCICPGWVLYAPSSKFERFPRYHGAMLLRHCFWWPYQWHIPRNSYQFGFQTLCPSGASTLPWCSWDWMASSCSKRCHDRSERLFSPHLLFSSGLDDSPCKY